MEKAKEYKYYSTQRPVDIGTFPKDKDNPPIRIENYEGRIWVENDTRLAWGELAYAQPLSEKELYNYELKPSRDNPDLRRTHRPRWWGNGRTRAVSPRESG